MEFSNYPIAPLAPTRISFLPPIWLGLYYFIGDTLLIGAAPPEGPFTNSGLLSSF
jgi:hypothetical protein